jgi:fucose permease
VEGGTFHLKNALLKPGKRRGLIVSLLIGFVLVYVGALILWSLNPFFAVFFLLEALYIVGRSILKGGDGEGPASRSNR